MPLSLARGKAYWSLLLFELLLCLLNEFEPVKYGYEYIWCNTDMPIGKSGNSRI